jgi:hypothetical protein
MGELVGLLFRKELMRPIGIVLGSILYYYLIRVFLPLVCTGYDYWILFVLITLAYILYIVLIVKKMMFPRASRNKAGVLFVISSENKKTYDHIKQCLVEKFANLSENSKAAPMQIIYIEKERVRRFDFGKQADIEKLLLKTNCLFVVNTLYTTDDADHSESLELVINLEYLNPTVKEEIVRVLKSEIDFLTARIKCQLFARSNSIQTFNATAQTLSYVCKSFLGITYIFSKDFVKALDIFNEIIYTVEQLPACEAIPPDFIFIIKMRAYQVCYALARPQLALFKRTRDLEYIKKYKSLVDQANELLPNTYGYYLDCAMLTLVIERDSTRAAQYIELCRKMVGREEWRYSEAFLCAYDNIHPLKLYRKYKSAFNTPVNILDIIEFIECILDEEPERGTLHLALVFIYNQIGDSILLHRHLAQYKKWISGKTIDTETIDLLKRLGDNKPCDFSKSCNQDCLTCVKIATDC